MRDRWRESLDVIVAALRDHEVEHHGRFWDFPRVRLNPRPVQSPHPALSYASTSVDGHRVAGALGLAPRAGNSLTGGWSYVEDCAETYKSAIKTATPVGAFVNDTLYSFIFAAHCADTFERAQSEAGGAVASIITMVTRMFTQLSSKSQDYAYMENVAALHDRLDDLPFLNDRAPYISLGHPTFLSSASSDYAGSGTTAWSCVSTECLTRCVCALSRCSASTCFPRSDPSPATRRRRKDGVPACRIRDLMDMRDHA